MRWVTWPRWPPCPYMVRTLKNLLLQNQSTNDLETWYVALCMWILPRLFKLSPWVDLDLFYAKVKFGHIGFCMGKSENYLFLAHLSTRCSRWAIVITLCPASVVSRPSSVVCRQQFIQSTSPPKLLDQFQNNFTQMFPWSSFTKIAKMVPLRWTKWPSELKIEKPLNNISSQANGPISK